MKVIVASVSPHDGTLLLSVMRAGGAWPARDALLHLDDMAYAAQVAEAINKVTGEALTRHGSSAAPLPICTCHVDQLECKVHGR